MNLMSAAILASDRVLTVSPNYALEIQSPEGGQGLHAILTEKGRQMRLAGILNGIADEWDPRTDPHIPRNYNLQDYMEGKAFCKKELQRSLGLHEDPGSALLGFCGRLCYQKGVHLITQARLSSKKGSLSLSLSMSLALSLSLSLSLARSPKFFWRLEHKEPQSVTLRSSPGSWSTRAAACWAAAR